MRLIFTVFVILSAILSGFECALAVNSPDVEFPLEKKIGSFSKLKRFGYDFFSQPGGKPSASNSPVLSVSPDYQIKPGDEFIIELSGNLTSKFVLPVGRDGAIQIPRTGKVYLNGKDFEAARKKVLENMAKSYNLFLTKENAGAKGTVVDITLGKISGVKLYVTGKALKRGIISLNGIDASILSALQAAGGVAQNGSLRNIQIKRQDGKVLTFDLYEFLIGGKLDKEYKYLKDGDIVFIPRKARKFISTARSGSLGYTNLQATKT